MKPFVMPSASATASASAAGPNDVGHSTNGINIPINHEHHHSSSVGSGPTHHQQHKQYYAPSQQQQQHSADSYGSPSSRASARSQHPQQPHQSQDYEMPSHIMRNMGFNPEREMDMGIFPRSSLSRRLDPFATLDNYHRKRSSKHDPDTFGNDGFSFFYDNDPHFDFPQFGTMGRRRAAAAAAAAAADPMADDMDFFNRVPSEFSQFMPDTFGHRRAASGAAMPTGAQQMHPNSQQYYRPQQQTHYVSTGTTPPTAGVPLAQSKKLCDAAIQTEDPNDDDGRSEVDNFNVSSMHSDNLNQHGLRNTVDMGVKSAAENELHSTRSHSAPPPEQQQQHQQKQNVNNMNNMRNTPPPAQGHAQFATQTTPPAAGFHSQQPPSYTKTYYSPQQHAHPQQKQKTPPPPQTPGGSYIRTIPIFVEGRSEPIINSHKEIPNQNTGSSTGTSASASASANARAYTPPHQQWQQPTYPQPQQQQYQQKPQQNRPTPLNTHQQTHQEASSQDQSHAATNLPPQTPHTIDSINKIQDIQRDVLDLMGRVEQFTGTRKDKHYAYLDEMLTRNLLKLDTIDTNGKESIRLARKEAIKCIQASINVLEAKAEQNAKNAQAATASGGGDACEREHTPVLGQDDNATQKSPSELQAFNDDKNPNNPTPEEAIIATEPKPIDATQIHEPIPLPPPEGMTAIATAPNDTNIESPPVRNSSNTPTLADTNDGAATNTSTTNIESK